MEGDPKCPECGNTKKFNVDLVTQCTGKMRGGKLEVTKTRKDQFYRELVCGECSASVLWKGEVSLDEKMRSEGEIRDQLKATEDMKKHHVAQDSGTGLLLAGGLSHYAEALKWVLGEAD